MVVDITAAFTFNVIHKLKHNKRNPIARSFTTFDIANTLLTPLMKGPLFPAKREKFTGKN